MNTIGLRRVDASQHAPLLPARHSAGFVRRFSFDEAMGRIGARGQIKAERYDAEAPALAGLRLQAERKQRRGYVT